MKCRYKTVYKDMTTSLVEVLKEVQGYQLPCDSIPDLERKLDDVIQFNSKLVNLLLEKGVLSFDEVTETFVDYGTCELIDEDEG